MLPASRLAPPLLHRDRGGRQKRPRMRHRLPGFSFYRRNQQSIAPQRLHRSVAHAATRYEHGTFLAFSAVERREFCKARRGSRDDGTTTDAEIARRPAACSRRLKALRGSQWPHAHAARPHSGSGSDLVFKSGAPVRPRGIGTRVLVCGRLPRRQCQRLPQNSNVQPEAPVGHVPQVRLDALLHDIDGRSLAAEAVHVSPPADAGFHVISKCVVGHDPLIFGVVGDRMRPGANQRLEDGPQIRQATRNDPRVTSVIARASCDTTGSGCSAARSDRSIHADVRQTELSRRGYVGEHRMAVGAGLSKDAQLATLGDARAGEAHGDHFDLA